ncbi:sensor histidine kinase [Amycolatopsis sp. CA-230715]|uniref:sensor histidine kinase n=1 Tax=Amycolatopsis sp. CA-230715 TaxID=2745196 RepID=UPI001C02F08F|nr:sensor histidine kinase [Amycolatopsis sp. CA-230715]QWF77975.1 hypothetical protein HUW46_01368 [Amycolatopsis sp. CA-230715]
MSEPEDHEPSSTRAELAAAHQRIADLTEELDTTNRGIIALHTELEAARDAEARAWARNAVLAERDRIARDLHDQVIQRVFSAGLILQGSAALIRNPRAAERVRTVIGELDATVRDLRTAIFGLHDHPQEAVSLRIQLADLIAEADDNLGFSPTVSFAGPIDAAVPDHIAADLLAVTREALSNLARHAHATKAELSLAVGDELVLRVSDNGRGLGTTTRSSGLRNMRERAQIHDGGFSITSEPGAGTRLEWRVPLPQPHVPATD